MPRGLRALLVRLHRWVGLAIAAPLALAGITGSVLAFETELDRWLNPDLFVVEAGPADTRLEPAELAARMAAALPGAEPRWLPLQGGPSDSVRVRMVPLAGPQARPPAALGYDEAFFDPYSGQLLGTRRFGESPFERRTMVGFLYRLHQSLALPPLWGALILGTAAILWTIDSLTGALLTLPLRGGSGKGWWSRWKPAWLIKRPAAPARRILDLHRASGLWLWGMLAVFAWSSVMLTLDPVYRGVMDWFVAFDEPRRALPAKPPEQRDLRLGWGEALELGRAAMREAAARDGFRVEREGELVRDRARNLYIYYVRSDLDIRDEGASTGVMLDAATGAVLAVSLPRKAGAAGNAVNQWMYGLHMAQVFGWPYRVFVLILGLVVAALSITGALIWWRKRSASAGQRHPRKP